MNTMRCFALSVLIVNMMALALPQASSVLAPPADFTVFTKTTDLIVIGAFKGTSERVWPKETRFRKILIDVHFAVSDVVKEHAQFAGAHTIDVIADTGALEEINALKAGQRYALFLKWDDHFEGYSFNYLLSGVYRLQGEEAVPMQPNTALVKQHGRLSRASLVSLAQRAAQQ